MTDMTEYCPLGVASSDFYMNLQFCCFQSILSIQLAVTRSTRQGEDKAFNPTKKRSGGRQQDYDI